MRKTRFSAARKRTNTWLFLAGATVLNIFLMVLSFALLFLFGQAFLPLRNEMGQWTTRLVWTLLFTLSVALGFLLYRLLFGLVKKRFPLDQWLDTGMFKGFWLF